MIIHPENTFSHDQEELLSSAGYCIGYNIDGEPERAMAVHPVTGAIIRKFWNGNSIWHPSMHRRDELVIRSESSKARVEKLLAHVLPKNTKAYIKWHDRPATKKRLANLQEIAKPSFRYQ